MTRVGVVMGKAGVGGLQEGPSPQLFVQGQLQGAERWMLRTPQQQLQPLSRLSASMATRGGRGSNWERQSTPRAGRAGLSKVLNQVSAFSIIFPACIYYLFENVFSPKLFPWAGSTGCYLGQTALSLHKPPHQPPRIRAWGHGPQGWTTACVGP